MGSTGVSQGALDLRLGMLALDRDFITPDQLREALAEQTREADAGRKRPLSGILLAKGYLSDAALEELLNYKRPRDADPGEVKQQDARLRDLLLKAGVPQVHLDECTLAQAEALARGEEYPRLAEIIVDRGFATPEAISGMLAVQKKAVLLCPACRKRYNVSPYNPLREYLCFHCKGPLQPTGEESRRSAVEMPVVRAEVQADPPALGKFRLLRQLGKGGMGVVYEALDAQLHRKLAVKLMLTSAFADPDEVRLEEERFIREARLSARLNHPNIVTVYEAGVVEGRRYLAMELIEGAPLSDWRRQGSVTIRQQVSILRDVALAVHHAHEQGVLHRDLKPHNILVDAQGRPHVMDFGLAKVVGKHTTLSLTTSGMLVGTPTYMSPEQVRGVSTIDRRTDIWSMGVMLYEILAGRPPFEGENPMEVLMKVAKAPILRPSRRLGPGRPAGIDSDIEDVCMKALTRDPDGRPPTAEAFAKELARWLKGGPPKARRPAR